MANSVEDMRKASAGANLNGGSGWVRSSLELETKFYSRTNREVAGGAKRGKPFPLSPTYSARASPRRRRLKDTLWFQRVMVRLGRRWQVISIPIAKKWAKHFPFVRKGGKVALARRFQICPQVIEK
jgi:hypothetical protein